MKKSRLTVLLVDDQLEMRKSLNRSLRIEKCSVLEACNGREALVLLADNKVDLIISDLRMPEMDGIEFLHEVRKSHSAAFILMTGFSEALEATEAYELGVDGFLRKPFKQEDLVSSMNDAIQSRNSLQTIESKNPIADSFCGIPVTEFLSGKDINFPVFLKLSDTKFVKLALHGEDLSQDKVAELSSKGIQYLYLRRDDFKNYVSFAAKITEAILKNRRLSAGKKASFLKHCSETIMEFGFEQYVDLELLDLASENIKQSLSLLSDSPQIFDILDALTAHSKSLYSHSMGVTIVASMMAQNLGWKSAPLTFRVVTGSLLHDIGKTKFPSALLERDPSTFSAEELALWQEHPKLGAEILSKVEGLPTEVLQVVLHHHEACDGAGYPNKLMSSKIHPVAKVVAVADEFFKRYRSAPERKTQIDPQTVIESIRTANLAPGSQIPKWEMLPALANVFQGKQRK